MGKNIKDCVSGKDYLDSLRESTNKIGFLVDSFKRLHSNIPSEDLESSTCGAKIATLYKKCNKDSGNAFRIIWNTALYSPCGSHLDYMLGVVSKETVNNKQPAKSGGRYGKLE